MKSVIETFKPVVGFEGIYEVSDYGTVRSLNYNHTGKTRYLKPNKQRDGYDKIDLCRDGKRKSFYIHRLVYEAFNSEIPEGYEIDHINTIRNDNRLDNLRVVTHKENQANPISVEKHRDFMRQLSQDPKWREAHHEGTRKSHNKPILQIDKSTGKVIREWECSADVERELGINHSNIAACCQGKRKSAGGYRWCFSLN